MKIQILCVGKIKDSYNKLLIEDYCKQIRKKNHSIDIKEYPDLKIPERLNENQVETLLEKECDKMIAGISGRDYVIALCIEGTEVSTNKHREYIQKAMNENYATITYVIGGSLGLPERIKKRANVNLSFSKMTFPHQLMRVVLCEEIYNVFI